MAFTANTAFEVVISNSEHNALQNVPGKFGTYSSSTYTPADCSAGTLVTKAAPLPLEGYSGAKNTNAFIFVACANGTSGGMLGDHTGIYAFNSYNVAQYTRGLNAVNMGSETLGLGLVGDTRGDFTEIIIGETYGWGVGNLASSTAPTSGQIYATIANGVLTPTSTLPTNGVYFMLEGTRTFTTGTSAAGTEYLYKACRAVANELPAVTTADNGKVLKVTDGVWGVGTDATE